MPGGWHFTWLAKPENIVLKLESYAHQEYNNDFYKDPARIQDVIDSGKDIIHQNVQYIQQAIDSGLPGYINNNPDKYRDWLINIDNKNY